MSYLDIVEEIGQPSIYIDKLNIGYQYDDYGIWFAFKYDDELEEYMCVELTWDG